MDMTFQEKSAWGLLAGIVLVSYFYFPAAFEAAKVPHGAPLIAISVVGVIALIIIEALYHAVIAASGGDESDERDALIDLKSERNAGVVLGVGLFVLIGRIVITSSVTNVEPMGALSIAVWILAVLTLSEVAKLLSQIGYYRIGS